jgi:hypothetical protein
MRFNKQHTVENYIIEFLQKKFGHEYIPLKQGLMQGLLSGKKRYTIAKDENKNQRNNKSL